MTKIRKRVSCGNGRAVACIGNACIGYSIGVRDHIAACGALVLLLMLVLVAGGCSMRSSPPDLQRDPAQLVKGRELFQSSCKVCHTLADADANGVFGPNLDVLQPDYRRVRDQIDSGGGGMPSHIIAGRDADLVAAYVAEVAGTSLRSG